MSGVINLSCSNRQSLVTDQQGACSQRGGADDFTILGILGILWICSKRHTVYLVHVASDRIAHLTLHVHQQLLESPKCKLGTADPDWQSGNASNAISSTCSFADVVISITASWKDSLLVSSMG